MAFSTNCTHKGCHKMMQPYIDKDTDKVFCSECDGEITSLTHFAKVQMKSSKQFRVKSTAAFAVKCDKCGKEDKPVLIQNEPCCCACKKPLDKLTTLFRNMLREQLKLGSDI